MGETNLTVPPPGHNVALETVERKVERVRFRVATGGHNIAEEAIRRRHEGFARTASHALAEADEAVIVDDSRMVPWVVWEVRRGTALTAYREKGDPFHDMLAAKVRQSLMLC